MSKNNAKIVCVNDKLKINDIFLTATMLIFPHINTIFNGKGIIHTIYRIIICKADYKIKNITEFEHTTKSHIFVLTLISKCIFLISFMVCYFISR